MQCVVGRAAAGKPVAACFSDEAGIGAVPQSMAKAASLRRRWGLVPAVMINWAAVSGPTP